MTDKPSNAKHHNTLMRAVIEVAFIVFLFYSNLLMGEFSASSGQGKTLAFALRDIFTATNFAIAICSALLVMSASSTFAKSLKLGHPTHPKPLQ